MKEILEVTELAKKLFVLDIYSKSGCICLASADLDIPLDDDGWDMVEELMNED